MSRFNYQYLECIFEIKITSPWASPVSQANCIGMTR